MTSLYSAPDHNKSENKKCNLYNNAFDTVRNLKQKDKTDQMLERGMAGLGGPSWLRSIAKVGARFCGVFYDITKLHRS